MKIYRNAEADIELRVTSWGEDRVGMDEIIGVRHAGQPGEHEFMRLTYIGRLRGRRAATDVVGIADGLGCTLVATQTLANHVIGYSADETNHSTHETDV